jgi:hypothetical protein
MERQAVIIEVRLERPGDISDHRFKHGGIQFADNRSYRGAPPGAGMADVSRCGIRGRG